MEVETHLDIIATSVVIATAARQSALYPSSRAKRGDLLFICHSELFCEES